MKAEVLSVDTIIMGAAEAYATYPTLRAEVEKVAAQQGKTFDFDRLTLHVADGEPPHIVRVFLPYAEDESTDV